MLKHNLISFIKEIIFYKNVTSLDWWILLVLYVSPNDLFLLKCLSILIFLKGLSYIIYVQIFESVIFEYLNNYKQTNQLYVVFLCQLM